MRMLTIALLVLISQTASATKADMKFNLFADSLETRFWKIFHLQMDEAEKYADNYVLSRDLLTNANKSINNFFPGLGIGFLLTTNDGQIQTNFYITAYGDKSKFPTVENLVKKAPKTGKYKIIAFNPPSYLDDSLNFNGKSIPTDSIEFSYKKNSNNGLNISLFFMDMPTKADNDFEDALHQLLQEFLGELKCAKLGYVDIFSADQKPLNQQTYKLENLYDVIATEFK